MLMTVVVMSDLLAYVPMRGILFVPAVRRWLSLTPVSAPIARW